MKNKHASEVLRWWWTPPFVGSSDQAVDVAAREFLAMHPIYTIGAMLEFLSQRVPTVRAKFAASHSHHS
jgi:hypothetical protein